MKAREEYYIREEENPDVNAIEEIRMLWAADYTEGKRTPTEKK